MVARQLQLHLYKKYNISYCIGEHLQVFDETNETGYVYIVSKRFRWIQLPQVVNKKCIPMDQLMYNDKRFISEDFFKWKSMTTASARDQTTVADAAGDDDGVTFLK